MGVDFPWRAELREGMRTEAMSCEQSHDSVTQKHEDSGYSCWSAKVRLKCKGHSKSANSKSAKVQLSR